MRGQITIEQMETAVEKEMARQKKISEITQLALRTSRGSDVILDWLADPNDKRTAEEVLEEACR